MNTPVIRIETLREFWQIAAVRAFWDAEQNHANHDRAHFELVCGLRTEILSPWVIAVHEGDRTCALLAGRRERQRFAPAIGYLAPFSLQARVIVVIHRCLVGHLDAAMALRCVETLRSALLNGDADAVEFHHLSEDGPLLAALESSRPAWLRRRLPRWSLHHATTLPRRGAFVDQRVSAKHRSGFRKRESDLATAYGNRLTWRWLTEGQDIPTLCEGIERAARSTYQRGLGVGFVDGVEVRERLTHFARRGELRVQLLEIDGDVRAFWYGTVYKGVFHSAETGYDPALRQHEVGTLMFLRMMDALIVEGVERVDFGLGDASYKHRFSNHSWRESSVWLFAPTSKGWLMRILLEVTLLVDRAARTASARLGATDRLKRLWRGRVTAVGTQAVAARPPDRTTLPQ